LPAARVAERLREKLNGRGTGEVRIGVGPVPIVAEGAARFGEAGVHVVGPRGARSSLSGRPLELVVSDERLLALLEGAGIGTCGELAGFSAESIEVRFGADGLRAWKLARADDPRILFRPVAAERPHASVDFTDYTVGEATRLVFTLNALVDQVCGILRERAQRARSITLTFALSGGGSARQVLRTARPTADRVLWMRRFRTVLERTELSDTISGVSLEVDSTAPVTALQGDLFDRGFATASFVEEAVTRLADLYRGLFVRKTSLPHPLAERRTRWVELTPEEIATTAGVRESGPSPALELHLLPEPRPIRIRTRRRRDHVLPIRYRDAGAWHELTAAGPDRISGGHEEASPYAREYFRCVSAAGSLLWIYRDAVEDRWYLHGEWE
jgi:hypothetical protein